MNGAGGVGGGWAEEPRSLRLVSSAHTSPFFLFFFSPLTILSPYGHHHGVRDNAVSQDAEGRSDMTDLETHSCGRPQPGSAWAPGFSAACLTASRVCRQSLVLNLTVPWLGALACEAVMGEGMPGYWGCCVLPERTHRTLWSPSLPLCVGGMLGVCECVCCSVWLHLGSPAWAMMALLKCMPAACLGGRRWRGGRLGGSLAVL